MQSSPLGIAVLGYGTVGSEVAKLLVDPSFKYRTICTLLYVLDRKPHTVDLPKAIHRTTDIEEILADDAVTIVVELLGGADSEIYDMCTRVLTQEKHLVTANKALMAEHGVQLCRIADTHGVAIGWEAACGGGMPIVRPLYDSLSSSHINSLEGIINGTCNYILTKMSHEKHTYADALQEAQRLGLAEANPSFDVDGHDAAQKLALLASLAFGRQFDWNKVESQGITHVDPADIKAAKAWRCSIKQIAMAQRIGSRSGSAAAANSAIDSGLDSTVNSTANSEKFALQVFTCMVPYNHALAEVNDAYNEICIEGDPIGKVRFYGNGAGGEPTASAVLSDIIGVASGAIGISIRNFPYWPNKIESAPPMPYPNAHYYLRIRPHDTHDTAAAAAMIAAVETHITHHPDCEAIDIVPHEKIITQYADICTRDHGEWHSSYIFSHTEKHGQSGTHGVMPPAAPCAEENERMKQSKREECIGAIKNDVIAITPYAISHTTLQKICASITACAPDAAIVTMMILIPMKKD